MNNMWRTTIFNAMNDIKSFVKSLAHAPVICTQ